MPSPLLLTGRHTRCRYSAIAAYAVFFGLFTQLVIWQINVPSSFIIDSLIRQDVLDQVNPRPLDP